MRKIKALLAVLALSALLTLCGCSMYGTYDTEAIQANMDKHQAGLAYLSSSLANVQAAAETAKLAHPENAARIDAEVRPVLLQLQSAVDAYERAWVSQSSNGADKYAVARSLLSTAVSVLGPVAINALVAR